MTVTNQALAVRLEAIAGDITEIKTLQKIANGRIGKIELAREREAGAREAVAHAAAMTAAETASIHALRDKSIAWKIGWTSVAIAAIGVVGTLAGVVAQLIVH